MKKILSIVGARPNFMKVAPVHREIMKHPGLQHSICHTGQHYDFKMSDVFFHDLEMPTPRYHLGIGSGSHAFQTGRIMIEFEKVVLEEKPDLVVVVGDVNSTIACSLVAAKLGIRVAHIEAGLRSFDRSMPEEINRILTDSISDLLFVSERSGLDNLHNEGVNKDKVHFVGNVMIDSLITMLPKLHELPFLQETGIKTGSYIIVTLHRPSNVDFEINLKGIVNFLNSLAKDHPVIFPIHPRTKGKMDEYGLVGTLDRSIRLMDPLGYTDFLSLLKGARLVVTDSGGIQEETTYMGVQCLTLRDNTERPVTTTIGTNHLAGTDIAEVRAIAFQLLNGNLKVGGIPELWDGKASERIVRIIMKELNV